MMDRKNYSFYMASDFTEKLEKVQSNDPKLAPLSKSQALYFIITQLAENIEDNVKSKS